MQETVNKSNDSSGPTIKSIPSKIIGKNIYAKCKSSQTDMEISTLEITEKCKNRAKSVTTYFNVWLDMENNVHPFDSISDILQTVEKIEVISVLHDNVLHENITKQSVIHQTGICSKISAEPENITAERHEVHKVCDVGCQHENN